MTEPMSVKVSSRYQIALSSAERLADHTVIGFHAISILSFCTVISAQISFNGSSPRISS